MDAGDREQLTERVEQLEQTVEQQQSTIRKMLPDRRGVIKGLGAAVGGGLLGASATGGASGQSAAGQVGSSSSPVDVEAANVNAGSVSTGSSVTPPQFAESAPLKIGGDQETTAAILLQSYANTGGQDEYKNDIHWVNDDGKDVGISSGDADTPKLSLYTADGAGSVLKRLDIFGGSNDVSMWWSNVSNVEWRSNNDDLVASLKPQGQDNVAQLRFFGDADGNGSIPRFTFQATPGGIGSFKFRNNIDGNDVFLVPEDHSFNFDSSLSAIRHQQTVSRNVVWQNTTTASRPSDPIIGQRVFDTDLGLPIWWDGDNWIDATGSTV